jgi:hypothetical protein
MSEASNDPSLVFKKGLMHHSLKLTEGGARLIQIDVFGRE